MNKKYYTIVEKSFEYNDEGYDVSEGGSNTGKLYESLESAMQAAGKLTEDFIITSGEELYVYCEALDYSSAKQLSRKFQEIFEEDECSHRSITKNDKEVIEFIKDNFEFFEVEELELVVDTE